MSPKKELTRLAGLGKPPAHEKHTFKDKICSRIEQQKIVSDSPLSFDFYSKRFLNSMGNSVFGTPDVHSSSQKDNDILTIWFLTP